MNRSSLTVLILSISLSIIYQCKEDSFDPLYEFPDILNFREIPQSPDNIATKAGVALGKQLFFDPVLSQDSTISCASCHKPEFGFADNRATSPGVGGAIGKRNSMALVNLSFYEGFFWDGRANSISHQANFPIPDSNEMNLPWEEAIKRLQLRSNYVALFKDAFGTDTITQLLVTKALEQFQTTLLAYNSKYDQFERGERDLSPSEKRGLEIFRTEKGDCFHCHQLGHELIIHPEKIFTNNGLDNVTDLTDFEDKGLGSITNDINDNGKFKITTLRNLAFTAPYMHDGRFETLEEVIEFYNAGPKPSPSLDNIMVAKANDRFIKTGSRGLQLSNQEKEDLKNFLLTFTDSSFINNPEYLP